MLTHHGTIRLPKGVLARVRTNSFGTRWRLAMRRRQVDQGGVEPVVSDELLRRITRLLGKPIYVDPREIGYLAFGEVDRHKDYWPPVYENGRGRAAAFLHVCIGGKATLKAGKESLEVKRGDVFSLNPNAWHSVPSPSLCITVCFTVPRAELQAAPSKLRPT